MFEALGGRKFLMTLLVMAAGVAIEIFGPNGMSATMASFMGGLVAIFAGSNAMITSKSISASGGESVDSTPEATPSGPDKVDQLAAQLDPMLGKLLADAEMSQKDLRSLQEAHSQLQATVANLAKAVLSTRQ